MTPAARAVLDAIREDRLTPQLQRAYRLECAERDAAEEADQVCASCGHSHAAHGEHGCYCVGCADAGRERICAWFKWPEPARPVGPGRKEWER